MEQFRVKEGLKTALLLSKAATSNHKVEIAEIGEVYIKDGYVAIMTLDGRWKRLTEENIETRLDELLAESNEESIKRRLQQMIFA
ncbi:MAG: hypothetical protein A2508_03430 [Candidatus Lambdaproteobacteria bacterium RIFOXYD12_FULL_49_8]|uniref:Uncharacterized protein n=1 Tax=Candidatus Lambdaproteobacteria bacterium RIFOXYD2_FULL_50_16 TaxID=1817772 RepID=A0A1F6GBS0_9PROT|nr:MAG: hypothetical protein A2527_06980 [Candidatus Lambdaproteobacteria bacterium RIFOXYD2_FULL_50_16]OGG96353.1 MAG: hypothetical protein A2508_03430 [Candidatus Lambdaproteobacteria bacterium RIFOXYD12_FULL_49_8]